MFGWEAVPLEMALRGRSAGKTSLSRHGQDTGRLRAFGRPRSLFAPGVLLADDRATCPGPSGHPTRSSRRIGRQGAGIDRASSADASEWSRAWRVTTSAADLSGTMSPPADRYVIDPQSAVPLG